MKLPLDWFQSVTSPQLLDFDIDDIHTDTSTIQLGNMLGRTKPGFQDKLHEITVGNAMALFHQPQL